VAKAAAPSSLRRQARDPHVAAATSEDEWGIGVDEALDPGAALGRFDLANEPPMPDGAEATRRQRDRPQGSMTAIGSAQQPSAWTRDLFYGGGLALAALVLASGWFVLRPRRSDVAPARSRD
jgi:hypothetical protein